MDWKIGLNNYLEFIVVYAIERLFGQLSYNVSKVCEEIRIIKLKNLIRKLRPLVIILTVNTIRQHMAYIYESGNFVLVSFS